LSSDTDFATLLQRFATEAEQRARNSQQVVDEANDRIESAEAAIRQSDQLIGRQAKRRADRLGPWGAPRDRCGHTHLIAMEMAHLDLEPPTRMVWSVFDLIRRRVMFLRS
jgi:hypothetical protein